MAYLQVLSTRHCGYMSEQGGALTSRSPTDELVNALTSQAGPQVRNLSAIFGSSLFLLRILTVSPISFYCDPAPTSKPSSPTFLPYPEPWPFAETSTMAYPNWDQSLTFPSYPPPNTGTNHLPRRQLW